ncbi:flagellar biosynthetic protein FliR [Vannielia sp.]|uniref:flagellar biosynthetic protein FliR n=1 Tax=Vannielia sp. TaxID=2813045 RepID=UPI002612E8EC|nr:flagellar biosynthetic protein FliR [Vannielia sp.]MDF1871728.1 flagellar biosynthetic protein FliR [Vannielia sp.]
MSEALLQLLGITQEMLITGFVVMLRVGGAMATMPALGERGVPMRVRLAATIALTVIVAPMVEVPYYSSLTEVAFSMTLASEAGIGVVFGLGLRFFIFVLQVAGTMAAQSTSLSQIFGTSSNVDPQPAMGHLLVVSGLTLAVMSDLHVQVAAALAESYRVLPVGAVIGASDVLEWGLAQTTRAFGMGFTLASPFIIASLIYNIALGVINRAMPQLMVAFVGAPAITAGGLILMFLATPHLLSLWLHALNTYLATPFGSG